MSMKNVGIGSWRKLHREESYDCAMLLAKYYYSGETTQEGEVHTLFWSVNL